MLGLANQVRLWRRGDEVSLQRYTLRHWLSLCRTGRLVPKPPLPGGLLARAGVLAARAAHSRRLEIRSDSFELHPGYLTRSRSK